jgi:hypothetical protein
MNTNSYITQFKDAIRQVEPIVKTNVDKEPEKHNAILNKGKKSTLAHGNHVPVAHKKPLFDRMV